MNFQTIDLAKDYDGHIEDFSKARNSFLEQLSDNEYVLFIDSDQEAPDLLLDHLRQLPPRFPVYWIRRIELYDGRWSLLWNPNWISALCSNRVRFKGRIHEVPHPRDPHGTIDIPIIHNHPAGTSTYRNPPFLGTRAFRFIAQLKRAGLTLLRGY